MACWANRSMSAPQHVFSDLRTLVGLCVVVDDTRPQPSPCFGILLLYLVTQHQASAPSVSTNHRYRESTLSSAHPGVLKFMLPFHHPSTFNIRPSQFLNHGPTQNVRSQSRYKYKCRQSRGQSKRGSRQRQSPHNLRRLQTAHLRAPPQMHGLFRVRLLLGMRSEGCTEPPRAPVRNAL